MSEIYLLLSQLSLSFLAKLDKADQNEYFNSDKVFERIESFKPEFVSYQNKI